jgi:hypothetical protein
LILGYTCAMRKTLLTIVTLGLIISGCTQASQATETSTPAPAPTASASATATITGTPTPQPRLTPRSLGPEREDFPTDVNPLTGLRVQDPAMLDLPAVLVSISNMPASARPQAGLAFAPWIFELYIGEGASRFMAAFYGDYPRRIPNVSGGCPVRETLFTPSESWVGNRVWLDENGDGRQDPWEAGVGGICVDLLDPDTNEMVESTSTDSNGYYAFNVKPGGRYIVQFNRTDAYTFTTPDVGNDDEDSDADITSGRTPAFTVHGVDRSWDAGLVLSNPPPPTASPTPGGTPPPVDIAPDRTYVGPIRSGRLTYNHFKEMFPASCLVYASAGAGIREQLEGCEIVYGTDPYSPNTALLDTSHMLKLAEKSKVPNQSVNYSGNLFNVNPPAGGDPATSLLVFFHSYTQSLWEYDPVSGAYLRQTDDADGKGVFHIATDRLTGRQVSFENIVVIRAEYGIFRHMQYDINLRYGLKGFGYLFRDGRMVRVYWSTQNRDWEKKTGLLRPLYFIDVGGNLVPLKPGRTWIAVMTSFSYLEDKGDGKWRAVFVQPIDPTDTPSH